MTIIAISVILVLAIILLITEKLPYDLTAFGIIVALVVLDILTPDQTRPLPVFPIPLP